jgi:uncharacterized protein YceH (UPF0502 family)
VPAASPAESPAPAGSGDADLRSKVEALEARVADLQAQLDAMRAGGTQATD